MKKNKLSIFISLIVFACIFISCNPARRLPNGSYLLNKNNIIINNDNIDSYEVSTIIKHKPNKRIFDLFRWPLKIYVTFDGKKQNGFKRWIKKNFGEAPVVLDTNLVNEGIEQLKLYLYNKGYFNAEVNKEIKLKNKKANVTYLINCNEPYLIKNYFLSIEDTTIKNIVIRDSNNYLQKIGMQFDTYKLSEERNRITQKLKNIGYYNFAKEFVSFTIDSNFKSNKLDINLLIQDPIKKNKIKTDSIEILKHIRYKIRNIIVNTDYNPIYANQIFSDSAIAYYNSDSSGSYKVLYNKNLKYSLSTLTQSTFFNSGEFYNLNLVNRTYTRLNELENFSYVNISFVDASDTINVSDSVGYLDCKIQLTPREKYSVFGGVNGTNSGGNLGMNFEIGRTNRNAFHGAELLSFKIGSSFEAQEINSSVSTSTKSLFNTIEFNGNIDLIIPKFFMPLNIYKFSKKFRPKTRISTGLSFQQRPDYNRLITNASFGYQWKQNSRKQHFLKIIDINSVKLTPDPSFIIELNKYNRRIKEQYTDHIIVAMNYIYLYDNQSTKKNNNIFLKFGIESVGNLLNGIMSATNSEKNSSEQYMLFGIPYANYILTDIDFRFNHKYTAKTSFAFRTAFGIGVPLKNSFSLPFEKSFYLGGANSMRGWNMRSLGPGSYNSVSDFERIGDLKFETNFELRYPIWDYFRGAFFVDAGNIWLLSPNASIPNGDIQSNRFYKEIAVDAGFGLRLDFTYFVIRFDAALPIIDPALPEEERWNGKNIVIKNTALKFGIGYPF